MDAHCALLRLHANFLTPDTAILTWTAASRHLTWLSTWPADSSIPAEHLAELAVALLDHLLASAPDSPKVQQSQGPEPAGPKAAQRAGRGRAGGRGKQAKRRQPSSKPIHRRQRSGSPEREGGDEEVSRVMPHAGGICQH